MDDRAGPIRATLPSLVARFMRVGLVALCAFAIQAAIAAPTTAPSTQPSTTPAADYELREWVVLVVDPNQPLANWNGAYKSTLPDVVSSRRTAAPPEQRAAPIPVGVIRLFGALPAQQTKVDVLLEAKAGQFISQWPKAENKPNRVLWANLVPTTEAPKLSDLDPNHWFTKLRSTDSLYLTSEGRGERFLMYDAQFAYPASLALKPGKDGAYAAIAPGQAPLNDVTLYKHAADGWHIGSADKLLPKQPATSSPATVAGASTQPTTKPDVASVFTTAASDAPAPATAPAAIAIAAGGTPATAPAMSPSTKPATQSAASDPFVGAAQIALAPNAVSDATQAVAPWRDELTRAGITGPDVDLVLLILASHALDEKHLTAVYRLDVGEMDRVLPIEVVPQPRKLTRVGLVIVRNIDPAIAEEVDKLIEQLGDPDWTKREAASKALADIGGSIKPKLEQATKHKDLEIVYRAEQLLKQIAKASKS